LSADELISELSRYGLVLRGVLGPKANDGWPALPSGEPARLWLVGAVGSSLWAPFSASPEFQDGQGDPLDRWSRRIGEHWAQRLGGLALFPFGGPPHWPFQRWADRAEPLTPSPLGLRLHPQHGLWHAYRFALLLPQRIAAPEAPDTPAVPAEKAAGTAPGACATCPSLCVKACPVGAHDHGFDLLRCVAHLRTPEGQICLQQGCQARAACPEGAASSYLPDHAAFHMQAFAARYLRESD
jgi:ferredoxin